MGSLLQQSLPSSLTFACSIVSSQRIYVRLIKPNVPKAIVQHIETASESHCVNPSSTSPGAELVWIDPKSWMSETDRGQVRWLHQNALLQVGFGSSSHHLESRSGVGVHQGLCRRLSSSTPHTVQPIPRFRLDPHSRRFSRPHSIAGPISEIRPTDRKSTRLNSSHLGISYALFC